MKWAGVMPFAYKPYADECMASMSEEFKSHILFVDDSQNPGSIGIMRAHNMGIDWMRQNGANWLVVISASVRFGEPGGMDFIKILTEHNDLHVINGAGKWVDNGEERIQALGWHLTAFKADVFSGAGRWDENFSPYGFDDVDLTLRMKKYFGNEFRMDTFAVDMEHTTNSHSIQIAGVVAPSAPRIAYFVEKWGRHPGAWQWDGWIYPFNNPEHSLKYWPQAANGGKWDD